MQFNVIPRTAARKRYALRNVALEIILSAKPAFLLLTNQKMGSNTNTKRAVRTTN